jgi:regulator of protease activity HflC (stomatin/prohibitin superfamily)
MAEYHSENFGDFKIPPGMGKIVVGVVVVIAALALVAGSTGIVSAGQRGVLLRFGAVTGEVKEEGLYFKIPFAEQVVLMSTQIQRYTAPASASSQDLQIVTTEITLNYQLDGGSVGQVYRDMRQDYENRVIQPFVQEAIKATTARYNAEELITQRQQVRTELQQTMLERLAPRGIGVVELSITDFQFTAAFQESIEAKVRAEQQALEAENALERVKFEAQQAITRAEAEARGLELQKAQITDQLLQLRQIEVQRTAGEKWNGGMPSVVTSGGPVPMLDVFNAAGR